MEKTLRSLDCDCCDGLPIPLGLIISLQLLSAALGLVLKARPPQLFVLIGIGLSLEVARRICI